MPNDGRGADASSSPPRLPPAAYLSHLLVPLSLLIDSLRAMLAHESGTTEKYIIAIASVWLVTGLGAWALADDRDRFLRRMTGPLLTFYGLLGCLILLELAVRFRQEHFDRAPLFFKPGTKIVLDLTPWKMPGLGSVVTFTINQLGLRGPMPPRRDSHAYKIITVGGSTTECGALDDSHEWPHLLMEFLNQRQRVTMVWVNNAGVSGLTAVDHLACLRRLPVLSQTDMLIFLVGANDLEAALEFDGKSTQRALERRADLFAKHAPPGVAVAGSLLKRAWLFPVLRQDVINFAVVVRGWRHRLVQGPQLTEETNVRAAGPILPLPDLGVNLREYAQRIRALESECSARHVRCVYLTQPIIDRPDLSLDDQHLLRMGKIGHAGNIVGYVSPADMETAMNAFNQVLLDVCRDDHLECYDLASDIPKNTSAFYDDFHFNIGGAHMVADFVADHLLASPFNRN